MIKFFNIVMCVSLFVVLCSSCTKESLCGNNTIDEGEVCDDGDTINNECSYGDQNCDQCSANCQEKITISYCGDGFTSVSDGEVCDDANTDDETCDYGDEDCNFCSSSCDKIITASYCGDAEITDNEFCDNADLNGTECEYNDRNCFSCNSDCTDYSERFYCGDGETQTDYGEFCDDGNTISEDCLYGQEDCFGCSFDCSEEIEPRFCGDNQITDNEVCDDGNTDDETCTYGDESCVYCNSNCSGYLANYCGDGKITNDEFCDDGTLNSNDVLDACSEDCTSRILFVCGDNIISFDEVCDDGNTQNETCAYGDETCVSCNSDCSESLANYCGDGKITNTESCDDGVNNSNTIQGSCQENCSYAYCGDGLLSHPEECDDGLNNSDTEENACRTNCLQSFCGDGIVDDSEECDGDLDNAQDCDINCKFNDTSFINISNGGKHNCAIDENGLLFCWGDNRYSQLAISQDEIFESNLPLNVQNDNLWFSISLGAYSTCAIDSEGSLFCSGRSCLYSSEESCVHSVGDTDDWGQIGTYSNWSQVVAGSKHHCAINNDQELFCWGYNTYGQLGNGLQSDANTPIAQVLALLKWSQVSVGEGHTCAIDTDDLLWCWGKNENYQSKPSYSTPFELSPVQISVGNIETWSHVSLGREHTCAITKDSNIGYCWGEHQGIYPSKQSNQELKVLATKHNSICFLDESNEIFCKYVYGSTSDIGARSDWSKLSVGYDSSCAIRDDSNIWCWGRERYLGINEYSREKRILPEQVTIETGWSDVAISEYQVCAVNEGVLWCTQKNYYPNLGKFKPVSNLAGWTNLSLSSATGVCGLIESDPFCSTDKFLYSDPNISQIALPTSVLDIQLGYKHRCLLTSSNELFCLGSNEYGQLGNNQSIVQNDPIFINTITTWANISVGSDHSCAISHSSELYCWGRNLEGQIGDNTFINKNIPTIVNLGPWTDVFAGKYSTCAIHEEGSLWCWGNSINHPYRVGNDLDWLQVAVGYDHICALKYNDKLYCWDSDLLQPKQIEGDFTSIVASRDFTCAIAEDTTLWCWGSLNNTGSFLLDFEPIDPPCTIEEASAEFENPPQYPICSNNVCTKRLDDTYACYNYGIFSDYSVKFYYEHPSKVIK